ncbi:MAG: RNA polymerase sigma factor [Solirubrobacteraceae bacterium]
MPERAAPPRRGSAPADAAKLASRGLRRFSESLTPAERAAFVLHDLMGLSNAEAASLLGHSPLATQRLLAAARRRLTAVGPPTQCGFGHTTEPGGVPPHETSDPPRAEPPT